MIVFQEEPDPIFVAIVHEALKFVRDVQLVCYRDDYRPTRRERQELDESYGDLFPELARFFSRPRLVRMIERLLRASRDEQRWYRLTDYHWLVLYSCLQTYCDLHNDEATGTGGKVGPYEIEKIDFNAVVDRFFFDTDFLMGSLLLQAEERAPGQLHSTREAWKIAAGLKPEAKDLRLERLATGSAPGTEGGSARSVPQNGYVGPYPLREPGELDGS
jgi:hypothetical protein